MSRLRYKGAMIRTLPGHLRACFLLLAGVLGLLAHGATPVRAAEIRVIAHPMAMGMLAELRVRFDRETGHRLVNQSSQAGGPRRLLDRGEGFDVALLPVPLLAEYAPRGVFTADGVVPLVRAPVAVAVRAGAPKPDIATPEALRSLLLRVTAFSYVADGEAGPQVRKILDDLRIVEAVRGKARTPPTVRQAIQAVAGGEAELFIGLSTVIAQAYGIEPVGSLPPPLGHDFVIATAIGAQARDAAAARDFVRFLASDPAMAVFRAAGFVPATR